MCDPIARPINFFSAAARTAASGAGGGFVPAGDLGEEVAEEIANGVHLDSELALILDTLLD